MEEKRIKEIVSDPNTWAWDGCTYPETDPYSKEFNDWLEKKVQRLKALQAKKKQQEGQLMTDEEFDRYCENLREEANGEDKYGFKPVCQEDVEKRIARLKELRAQGWGKEEETETQDESCVMTDERIQEILKDPNTWLWDGCTYPETDPYPEEFHKEMDERMKRLKEVVRKKQQEEG